ncbi:MAG TPA: transporter substrate-binding domain-containing protein [Anaerolineaceae bacterium]|nr:transporter substrate-binding domain-containing protein [Anaerolineaceae bacterium]HQP59860.1 transporter substrate-binding domain-containing protein [Anaerolineaceae bacterium]
MLPQGNRHRRVPLLIIILGMLLLTFASMGYQPVGAFQPTPGPEKIVILVGGDHNYPPYSYLVGNEIQGFDNDLIRAVGEAIGAEVVISLSPWAIARQRLESGEVDVIAGMAFSMEREAYYDFSVPTTEVSFDIFRLNGSPIRSLDDLRDKRIIVQEGGIMHDYLLERNLAGEIIPVLEVPDALTQLSMGNADAAILNKMQGLYFIQKYHMIRVEPAGLNLESRSYGMAVKEGNQDLLFQLNNGLNILKTTGEYQRIYEKWFGVYQRANFFEQNALLFSVLGIIILLLVIFILWSQALQSEVRKRTSALKQSEEKYRSVVENMTDGILVTVGERVLYVNHQVCQMTGYTSEELLQISILDLVHREDKEIIRTRTRLTMEGKIVPVMENPIRIYLRQGGEKYVLIQSVGIQWEGQQAVMSILTDITQQKQVDADLQRQLNHLDALRSVDLAILSGMEIMPAMQLLLQKVIDQLGVDAADVLVHSREEDRLMYLAEYGFILSLPPYTRIEQTDSLANKVMQTKHIVSIPQLGGRMGDRVGHPLRVSEGFHSYYGVPLQVKDQVKGVLEIFHRTSFELDRHTITLLQSLADQAAIMIENADLFRQLEESNQELTEAYDATIRGWARALDLRNAEAGDHTRRLLALTVRLAQKMGVLDEEMDHLRRGVVLHDIGKMAIPDEILLKPGPLTAEEWDIMRQHPIFAQKLLATIPFLQKAVDIPVTHHERWDGTGYPAGLRGEEIPLAGRIFAVVDVWDALTHDRVYHTAWSREQALAYLRNQAGSQFDPQVVEKFFEILNELEEI